jgi:alkaline phosphatase D
MRLVKSCRLAVCLLWLLWTVPPGAAAERLIQAGPMVGHVSDSEALVWIRSTAALSVTGKSAGAEIEAIRIEDLGDDFRLIRLGGLRPASRVEAVIEARPRAGGATALVEKQSVAFRTAPAPAPTGRVRLAFGSCAKVTEFKSVPAYAAIAAERPDLMIFAGDNSYFIVGDGGPRQFSTTGPEGDWSSAERMLARHLETRMAPELQRLIRSVPSYAIWDDHDYGPNNADSTFPLRREALRVFRQVWANPDYGTPETPGIFSSFRHGPVEIFLMDDRYHKLTQPASPDAAPPPDPVIWGHGQLQWLMNGLKASTAAVKLIVNGTQVICESTRGEGHFSEALAERQRLFGFLSEHRIGGIIFLSGDRHHTEMMRLEQPGGPDILEFTSSPLQQGQKVGPLPADRKHRTQLWSMRGNSYGLVTINIPKPGAGTVRFEARDEKNQLPIVDKQAAVTQWDLKRLMY